MRLNPLSRTVILILLSLALSMFSNTWPLTAQGGTSDRQHPNRILVSANRESGNYTLNLFNTLTREATQFASIPTMDYGQIAISPDGKQVLFVATSRATAAAPSNKDGLYIMNIDGTGVKQLVAGASLPVWSPDGTKIAYSAFDEKGAGIGMFIMNADATGAHAVVSGSLNITGRAVWGLNRGALLYAEGAADGYRIQLADNASGENTVIVGNTAVWSEAQLHFASSQIALFDSGQNVILSIYNLKTRARKIILQDPKLGEAEQFVSWSPDGSKLAGSLFAAQAKFPIYTINADGSGFKIVTDKFNHKSWVAWSPDGKSIAFGTFPDSGSNLKAAVYVVAAAGGEPKLLVEGINATRVLWSPDSSQLALISLAGIEAKLDVVDAADGKLLLHLENIHEAADVVWQP